MLNVRSASHAGSWYSAYGSTLERQLNAFFAKAKSISHSLSGENTHQSIPGARILIGPHAGYLYSGERLAEAFNVWDTSKVKRVFMLGPSHHVYFKSKALVSRFDAYETPLGNIPVDTEVAKALVAGKGFRYMSEEVDEEEHSFEMHAPFIYYATQHLPQGVPKIVPIMISDMDDKLSSTIVEALLPFLEDEGNHFIISSDFCHWGARFGYTQYLAANTPLSGLATLTSSRQVTTPIHKSIEALDKAAMEIASKGDSQQWDEYIITTGNTICGHMPISVVLKLLERFGGPGFEWIGYSQSNSVKSIHETSVSYASGYVKI
ncbi:UPF0103-domain-containing protein [Suhomyces tanzawaensis NRRL Y-17324]|uniref:UPF0103-domain-containing protein n=1 Tax=Suhomyces tanzawaensis NRRL Y-17324 TaxID=984487 RepID=A0A1E4SD80_9ASCO|nr:UPF0103-domain-containing protein [Suhomyces tanzawaensis NRRL Y-17324]ODV77477.1 UPF0103-domain-containing protein [Suhomyces tanzawaensis NRRL Y-17324]